MIKSIRYFEENCIKNFEKFEDDFMKDPTKLAEYVIQVTNELHQLGLRMIEESLESMDEMIRQSGIRKRDWVIESTAQKQMITSLGTIMFKKTLFTHKGTGKSEYLLDRIVGFEKNQRLTEDAEARMMTEAVQTSYRRGGEESSLTTKVEKQTVKNKIHRLRFPEAKRPAKKKVVDYLYLEADEDHVALQFNKTKGDLLLNSRNQKNNTLQTKLVYVHEGIEPEAPRSKRHRLINPHYFCGTAYGEANRDFWDEIYKYLDDHYELDHVKKIYLNADGGTWIRNGMRRIQGITYVLDEFHLEKYLTKMTGHMKESQNDAKAALRKAIRNKEKASFVEVVKKLESYLPDEASENRLVEGTEYILSNWTAAKIRLRHTEGVLGSSTEGHVSHVLSSRMSSRPMGWSQQGATKMCKLRAYYLNKGDMLELVRYQKEALPKASGDEAMILSSAKLISSERNRHEELGKYMKAINHTISNRTKKALYFNGHIWGL